MSGFSSSSWQRREQNLFPQRSTLELNSIDWFYVHQTIYHVCEQCKWFKLITRSQTSRSRRISQNYWMDCQVKHVDLRHSSWFFWWCVFLAYPDCTQIDFRKKKTQNVQSFLQIGSKTKVGGLKCKSDQISTDASQSSCSFVSLEQRQIYRDRRADVVFLSDLIWEINLNRLLCEHVPPDLMISLLFLRNLSNMIGWIVISLVKLWLSYTVIKT